MTEPIHILKLKAELEKRANNEKNHLIGMLFFGSLEGESTQGFMSPQNPRLN